MSRARDAHAYHSYEKMVVEVDQDNSPTGSGPIYGPGGGGISTSGLAAAMSSRRENDRRELQTISVLGDGVPEVHGSHNATLLDSGGAWVSISHQAPHSCWSVRRAAWPLLATTLVAALLAYRAPWAAPRDVKDFDTLISDSEVNGFVKKQGYNCWAGNGGDPVIEGDDHSPRPFKQCKLDCLSHKDCQGVIVVQGADPGNCWLRKNLQLAECNHYTSWDLWVKDEVEQAQRTTTKTSTRSSLPKGGQVGEPGSSLDSDTFDESYAEKFSPKDAKQQQKAQIQGAELEAINKLELHKGYNCWAGNGGDTLPGHEHLGQKTLEDCKLACVREQGCEGVIVVDGAEKGNCWMRHNIDLSSCAKGTQWDLWLQPVQAPVHEFYMYRATAPGDFTKFPIGQVNTANMDGLIWYLMNEVVTNYSKGARCPRKFGISEIHRMKVRTRATPELAMDGMNFGARFAYDFGECMGRCFPNNKCTGGDDCESNYRKYGFVIGCNRFSDKWPFPNLDTATPNGIWYSLPLGGRCAGVPTGAKDCTWSYEDAGMVTLEEVEATSQGQDNCCNKKCTNFWVDQFKPSAAQLKVNQALDVFKKKYPAMPRDLEVSPCDFNRAKWYTPDNWPRRDPWR